MATRVDLAKDFVKHAFDTKLASLKRSANTASNPIIKDALDKEIAAIQTALNTLTEIK